MPWREPLRLHAPLKDAQLSSLRSVSIDQALAREEAAFARGAAAGESRLSQQLIAQRAEIMSLQTGVLTSLQKAAADVIRQSEQAMVQLAMAIAEKIVGDLPVTAPVVAASVRAAIADADQATAFQIKLHPEDLALLQQSASPLLQPGPSQSFQFEPSAAVNRGGCIVTTQFGVIDARRETRRQLLAEALAS